MYVIVSCTNRKESVTSKLCSIYADVLSDLGVTATIIDLCDLPGDYLESALYDNSGKNELFNPSRDVMEDAKKFVFVIPEYNGSFPGVLKAFIDGLKFPKTFTNKKCALVGLSSGQQGAGLALSHLTDILNYCGTHVLAFKPKLSNIDDNMNMTEKMLNDKYLGFIKKQAVQFVAF